MLTEKSKPDFAWLPLRPKKLISLLDMIPHSNRFLAFWISANSFLDSARDSIMEKGEGARADEKFRNDLTSFLIPLKNDCHKLEMTSIVDRIDHFLIKLIAPLFYTVIRSEINTLLVSINQDAYAVKFAL